MYYNSNSILTIKFQFHLFDITGVPFPKNFQEHAKSIFKRLFRYLGLTTISELIQVLAFGAIAKDSHCAFDLSESMLTYTIIISKK